MKTKSGKYDDIIHLPHHVSTKHPPMDPLVRAAQFSPFAALTGYDAAIQETGRQTDRFVELEEYEKSLLDEALQQLKQQLQEYFEKNRSDICLGKSRSEWPAVSITYFQPDARKEGGAYVQISGAVRRIDEHRRVLVMADGEEILLDLVRALVLANF